MFLRFRFRNVRTIIPGKQIEGFLIGKPSTIILSILTFAAHLLFLQTACERACSQQMDHRIECPGTIQVTPIRLLPEVYS